MSLALVMSSEGGSLLCISNCFCFWLQILMMEGLWSGDKGRREGYMEETQQVSYQENWCCLCLFPSSLVPFICFVYQNKIINLMSLNTLFIVKTLELFECFHIDLGEPGRNISFHNKFSVISKYPFICFISQGLDRLQKENKV